MKKYIQNIIDKTSCRADVRRNEPMGGHTTFKVGGPADFYVKPLGDNFPDFCVELFKFAKNKGVRIFILGGGANIVVSDNGIRGIVLDTSGWKGLNISASNGANEHEHQIVLKSGTTMDEAAEYALEKSLSGLEFLAGMPGSIGGACFMNARCYGREIADVLTWAEIIKTNIDCGRIERMNVNKEDFDYKISPFQKINCLILSAAFILLPGDKKKIKEEMERNRRDRKEKGHYLYPCAGSVFKNNREFGKPSGQIIDELGLRGLSIGGAQIAPFHGNIIINTGSASASDIRALMDEASARVKTAAGFALEPEILFIN